MPELILTAIALSYFGIIAYLFIQEDKKDKSI